MYRHVLWVERNKSRFFSKDLNYFDRELYNYSRFFSKGSSSRHKLSAS
ncbi:MAG: hypothetical protein ACJARL_001515 [Halopseudomonas sp.]|jgi:hypothetical protein